MNPSGERTMLSPDQVTSFRSRTVAARSIPTKGEWAWRRCVDGPLDGLDVRIRPGSCDGPTSCVGWSYPTSTYLVVALYREEPVTRLLRFAGFESPGAGASASVPGAVNV